MIQLTAGDKITNKLLDEIRKEDPDWNNYWKYHFESKYILRSSSHPVYDVL